MKVSFCTHCGHETRGKVRNCPMCGGEIRNAKPNGDARCPRCRITLDHFEFRENNLDRCGTCQGLWLDIQEFDRLTSECDVYRDLSIEPEYVRPNFPKTEGYLPCAHCGNLMSRRSFGGSSGVMIDVCRDHGVWLDDGELKQIRQFIASGGLEKSQNTKLARQAASIGSLDTRVSHLEFLQRTLHKWDMKRWMFSKF